MERYIDNNGYQYFKCRRIKMKPYGRKPFTGYGGETYMKKFGEFCVDIVNAKYERRQSKKLIERELDELND